MLRGVSMSCYVLRKAFTLCLALVGVRYGRQESFSILLLGQKGGREKITQIYSVFWTSYQFESSIFSGKMPCDFRIIVDKNENKFFVMIFRRPMARNCNLL